MYRSVLKVKLFPTLITLSSVFYNSQYKSTVLHYILNELLTNASQLHTIAIVVMFISPFLLWWWLIWGSPVVVDVGFHCCPDFAPPQELGCCLNVRCHVPILVPWPRLGSNLLSLLYSTWIYKDEKEKNNGKGIMKKRMYRRSTRQIWCPI